jgi:hypothetical protein
MTIRTPLCDMLGIQYPIMLAGMGGVSYAELAAAVSNAGGFGTLGMAGRSHEEIKAEIKRFATSPTSHSASICSLRCRSRWSAPRTSSSKAARKLLSQALAFRRRIWSRNSMTPD